MQPLANSQLRPRRGLDGLQDRIVGTGATPAELRLIFGLTLLAVGGQLAYALLANLGWNIFQLVVVLLIVTDLVGGFISNATISSKRWWHRDGQGFRQHFLFVAAHVVYPLVIAWLFRGGDWLWADIVYGYLLVATGIVLATPRYLQRPVAMAMFAGALLLQLYAFAPTPGLEWFIPVLFLKLIVCHLLNENS